MQLTLLHWLLAFAPIAILMVGILALKWEAAKVGSVSLLAAAAIAFFVFGADGPMLAMASAKGLGLALYVALIIWGAVLLYNIAEGAGAIKVISRTMSALSSDPLTQILLLSWCFAPVLQGLAGFGVPVAVVAPILVSMGFQPLVAVSACLIGHSWSISFGSMGSSYNSIQLVTGIEGSVIGPCMAVIFWVAIFATGFGVAHIHSGFKGVRAAAPKIATAGAAMAAGLYGMNLAGLAQLSTLTAGILGCAVMIGWTLREKRGAPASGGKGEMPLIKAAAPYLTLVGLSILSQIGPIKSALKGLAWGLDYPAFVTGQGYAVAAANQYSKISWFAHPAPILLVSALVGMALYRTSMPAIKKAASGTVKRCIPMCVGIMTMVMMALIMSDMGLTNMIARGVAAVMGTFYPLAAPFIGVLGSFITGSNTNSNIMFGVLQTETAGIIGVSPVLMAAAQSVGGSLGVSMAISTIMMGSANVGLAGQESSVMAKTIRYCLLSAALVGIFVFILARVGLFSGGM